MRGWLVVNSFVESEKFAQIYSLLLDAAAAHGISLLQLCGDELCDVVGDGFQDKELPDFAIFWDKDILLARLLEDAGVRLFNCADAIDACDNKAKTYIRLARAGIRIPKTVIAPMTFEGVGCRRLDFLDKAIERLGLPLVIKEVYGSFGRQVYLARTRREAEDIIEAIGHKGFVLQEFAAGSAGRDLRINIVGERAVATILRQNENDFRSNVSGGARMEPYTPSEAQERIAVDAVRALGLDFAGVDVLFGADGEPLICEVNSNPHFKNTLDCTGVDLAEHIMGHIQSKLT